MTEKKTNGQKKTKKKRKPGPGRKEKYPLEQIKEAIRVSGGYLSKAAEALGTHYHVITYYMDKYPELKELMQHINEKKVDFTENQLYKRIAEGDSSLIKYHLNCSGRSRGWGERKEIAGVSDQPITIKIIEQISDD